jgi:hypothetical protein
LQLLLLQQQLLLGGWGYLQLLLLLLGAWRCLQLLL